MDESHAAARVRRRLIAWVKERGHGSRKALAEAVKTNFVDDGRSPSWATSVLRGGPEDGGADLRLRDLDAVASLLDVPPGDLVKRDGDHYMEVTHSEARLLRFYRSMPDMIRHHFVAYAEYLEGLQEQFLAGQAELRDQRTAEAKRVQALAERERKRRRHA